MQEKNKKTVPNFDKDSKYKFTYEGLFEDEYETTIGKVLEVDETAYYVQNSEGIVIPVMKVNSTLTIVKL